MFKLCVVFCLVALSAVVRADIHVSDAWLRESIPGQRNTAGYLQLHNSGARPRQLIAVESDFAEKAELHTQQLAEGMMKMRKLSSIDIAAHGRAELVPGGQHIMFFQLHRALGSQENWPLTLIFADGERIAVDLAVRSLSDLPSNTHSHHQH